MLIYVANFRYLPTPCSTPFLSDRNEIFTNHR